MKKSKHLNFDWDPSQKFKNAYGEGFGKCPLAGGAAGIRFYPDKKEFIVPAQLLANKIITIRNIHTGQSATFVYSRRDRCHICTINGELYIAT